MLVLSSLFGSTVAPRTNRLSSTSTDSPNTESCPRTPPCAVSRGEEPRGGVGAEVGSEVGSTRLHLTPSANLGAPTNQRARDERVRLDTRPRQESGRFQTHALLHLAVCTDNHIRPDDAAAPHLGARMDDHVALNLVDSCSIHASAAGADALTELRLVHEARQLEMGTHRVHERLAVRDLHLRAWLKAGPSVDG